jgi:hypothetical protein
VLDLHASGEGWGQIAQDLGLNLDAVVSSSHTDQAQAGMEHVLPTEGSAAHAGHASSTVSADHPQVPFHAGRPGG